MSKRKRPWLVPTALILFMLVCFTAAVMTSYSEVKPSARSAAYTASWSGSGFVWSSSSAANAPGQLLLPLLSSDDGSAAVKPGDYAERLLGVCNQTDSPVSFRIIVCSPDIDVKIPLEVAVTGDLVKPSVDELPESFSPDDVLCDVTASLAPHGEALFTLSSSWRFHSSDEADALDTYIANHPELAGSANASVFIFADGGYTPTLWQRYGDFLYMLLLVAVIGLIYLTAVLVDKLAKRRLNKLLNTPKTTPNKNP